MHKAEGPVTGRETTFVGSTAPRQRAPWIAASVLAVALTAWTAQQAVVLSASEWRSSQTRFKLERWKTGELKWTDAEWEEAQKVLLAALAVAPDNPDKLESLALLYEIKAASLSRSGAEESPGAAWYGKALALQLKAVELRPYHPVSWTQLASLKYATGAPFDEVFEAWKQALKFGPNESNNVRVLEWLLENMWNEAPPEALRWVEANHPDLMKRVEESRAKSAAAAAAAAASSAASGAAEPAPR